MSKLLLARTLSPHSTVEQKLGDKMAYISVGSPASNVCFMLNTVNPVMKNKGFEVKVICWSKEKVEAERCSHNRSQQRTEGGTTTPLATPRFINIPLDDFHIGKTKPKILLGTVQTM
jgi:hypothetical protein